MKNRVTLTAVAILALVIAGADNARGTVYDWTGAIDYNLNVDGNWAGGTQPAGIGSDQPSTPAIGDSLVFDSATWTRKPRTLYTRTTRKWGSIVLKNGTVDWKNDGNNQGNYSWGGTDTLVVGDGDATAAWAQFNVVNWNKGGTTGTKTYVINSDGKLSSNRGGAHQWSNGATYDTVMRLLGGEVDINGAFDAELTGDSGDYVVFEAAGSKFTANYGGALGDIDAVKANMGAGMSFRPAAGLVLTATDGGTRFTIEASVIIQTGTAIFIK